MLYSFVQKEGEIVMEKELKKEDRRRTIRTKLLIVTITLVVLSIIAIIASVTYETYSGMRLQMREDSEFLLENVASRLSDNNDSIEFIEGIVDTTILEPLEAIKESDYQEITNEEINEIAKYMRVDELNLFSLNGEITHPSIPENIGRVFDSEHEILIFMSSNEEMIIEDIREKTLMASINMVQ